MKRSTAPTTLPLLAALLALTALLGGVGGPAGHGGGVAAASSEATFIDTHNHLPLAPGVPGCDLASGALTALDVMDAFGIARTLILHAPHLTPSSCEAGHLAAVVAAYPDRFAFLAGGESLNPMIQSAIQAGTVTASDRLAFEETALDILRLGAVGLGEMTAEHFSFHAGHPYITAPPDHELFLLLAEIAGRFGVPVDLHMEAIAADTPFTDVAACSTATQGAPNPATLSENIAAFERLLAHDRRAPIVWVHAGWDNTGDRTPLLTRRLLADHPNLYVQLRPLGGRPCNGLYAGGKIHPGWLAVIRDFPERFVMGVDSFYPPDIDEALLGPLLGASRNFVGLLAPDLARMVGTTNAVRLYNLDRRLVCHKPGTRAERTMWIGAAALGGHLGHGDTVGPCR